MAPEAVRRDRILDEAFATGGDLRMLCELFSLSIAGAYHYTTAAGDEKAMAALDAPPR